MQNDGELRATGGFMTAYAIIKIESGKVSAEASDSVNINFRQFGN